MLSETSALPATAPAARMCRSGAAAQRGCPPLAPPSARSLSGPPIPGSSLLIPALPPRRGGPSAAPPAPRPWAGRAVPCG